VRGTVAKKRCWKSIFRGGSIKKTTPKNYQFLGVVQYISILLDFDTDRYERDIKKLGSNTDRSNVLGMDWSLEIIRNLILS
jgi:hypothetical protein